MKKVRVILASAACMVAAAGVFASQKTAALATVFYIPSAANASNDPDSGTFCTVQVTPACPAISGIRCTMSFNYGGIVGARTPIVSKRIDSGNCVEAWRN